ncbi:tyrosine-type recombinase/integrase [Streptomyces sp. NBC_01023]|uniref:tyrosine-type recombinase/integrase n=1 Tax=Streptomyces sp. NBC_01023 TaxID=2903724 RepID=UPI00386EFEFD|nr:tyrosine-type recombinase/integrase [Streptomyces sp. NBC_01023]
MDVGTDLVEIVDAELVEVGAQPAAGRPTATPFVDHNTVLRPGEELPTAAEGPRYTERDLYVSEETARALDEAGGDETGPRGSVMRRFRSWCTNEDRVAVPCTTATYTEYGRHLMGHKLKVATIRNYMSLIRTSMPVGKQPDSSLYLQLLKDYRTKNKRASRKKQAFPITLPYLVPMMRAAEADDRPIGWRDAAMFAFGYRFLARRIEDADLDIEDLDVLDDRIVVWLLKDKTHQEEEQTLTLHDRPDLDLVSRMRRWLAHLADQGITSGPLFRHVLKDGTVATTETRQKTATVRGDYLRGHTVNERVQLWFKKTGLVTDGRPVSAQGLRAGGATDLAEHGATDEELEEAGRWAKGSPIPRRVYVRPAQQKKHDPFAKIPVYGQAAAESEATGTR